MIRLKWKRKAALRVALGAVVATMCATPAAEAKIFQGKLFQTLCETARFRATARFEARADVATPNEPTILPAPVGSGSAAFYVAEGIKTPLFNGVDLSGWTSVEGGAPGEGGKVVDGTIFREKNAGDLYFDGKFENFILYFIYWMFKM